MNTLLVARGEDITLITASDRLRPEGVGFGVALAHVYPSTLYGDVLEEVERVAIAAVRAIGLHNGIAYPQLLVSGNDVRVIEIAARIPAGQMDEVPRFGVGIDLLDIALKQALGEPVSDDDVHPSLAAAAHNPLPDGGAPAAPDRRRTVGRSARQGAGVSRRRARRHVDRGGRDDPTRYRRDGDRRGYVIARGDTNFEALERADAAAGLIDVLTS